MTLLAPEWLLTLLVSGVILVLHAVRRPPISVPSVYLWKAIPRERSVRRRRLRRPPFSASLLLQLLFVALAALTLAQPRIGTGQDWPDHVAFVLDASGSMQSAPGRYEAAQAYLSDAMLAWGSNSGTRVSLVHASPHPRVEVARQIDATSASRRVDQLTVSDGVADWTAVRPLLQPLVRIDEDTRVVVLTDDPMLVTDLEELGTGIQVEHVLFGDGAVANAGLNATVTRAGNVDDRWLVTGTVRFDSALANSIEIAVLFKPDGWDSFLTFDPIVVPVSAADDTASAAEDRTHASREVPFATELELPGKGSLILRLPDDGSPHDNDHYAIVQGEPSDASVLVVGTENANLLSALQTIDHVSIRHETTMPVDSNSFDLVIVDDVTIDALPRTNVLFLGRGRVDDGGGTWPSVSDRGLTGWDADHPLSRGINWNIVPIDGFSMPALNGAYPVVEGIDGPLIQARTSATGREIYAALAVNGSEWTTTPAFPVFVGNVVRWLNLPRGERPTSTCLVGNVCVLEARFGRGVVYGPDVGDEAADIPQTVLTGPDAAFVPDRTGLYRIEIADAERWFAVNGGSVETIPVEAQLSPRTSLPRSPDWPRHLLIIGMLVIVLALMLLARAQFDSRMSRSRFLGLPAFSAAGRGRFGLQIAVIVLLLLGLVSVSLPTREPAMSVALVDAYSVPTNATENGDRAADPLADEIENLSSADNIGLVSSGRPSQVSADLEGGDARLSDTRAPSINLEQLLLLAKATLPSHDDGRIVLVSDGVVTEGNVALALPHLAADAVPVDILPIPRMPPGEVIVEAFVAPTTVYAGESFVGNAVIFADESTEAEILFLQDGILASEMIVTLEPGRNRVQATFDAPTVGDVLLEVTITTQDDVIAENNNNGMFVKFEDRPSVLIATSNLDHGSILAEALALQGIDANVVLSSRTPHRIDQWLEYDVGILMNAPAIDFTVAQQELIADFVEVHGRGLLLLGGEQAFGPGGYYQTDLERISPLSSRIPQDTPGAAMVFVIDRSGSMGASVGTTTRLSIAKEATLDAIELLHEENFVGIVVFDSLAQSIIDVRERGDPAVFADALMPVVAGGGTALLPALSSAVDQLESLDVQAKHIVVMTDGLVEQTGFPPLLQRARDAGITVSTVAIGDGANGPRMAEIARLGDGAFHAARDFRALPSILSQEAFMLSGSPVRAVTTPVTWVDRDEEFLTGLPEALPALQGYVATTVRPTADLHIEGVGADGHPVPIMSSWRYGSGQVLALATQGAGPWSASWLQMAEYPRLWSQIIRQYLPSTDAGYNATTRRQGDILFIDVEAISSTGIPLEGENMTLTFADDTEVLAGFEEYAPGLYSTQVLLQTPGTLRFAIVADGEPVMTLPYRFAYPSRLNLARTPPETLATIALATGGSVLTTFPTDLYSEKRWALASTSWPWIVAALALFIVGLTTAYAPRIMPRRRPR